MTQELKNQEYDRFKIEEKWQKLWDENHVFEADKESREKYFINFPFPYINGTPHLGHGYSLMKGEIMARYQRMLGKNVLFPFAFHATGEPIVGMAKRVKKGDKSQIRALKLSGVSDDEIPKFEDPRYIIKYFRKSWTDAVKALGMGIDWRRQFVTTQLTPTFSKFIEWHYRKLRREGYVFQGSHPVIWCPADQNPTGDHDRLEGEGARVVDFIVLKFYSETHDAYFLPATLRPETIFGVTNMFLHPEAKYIKVNINGDDVIIAERTLIKFKDQQFEVGQPQEIPIEDLIGTYVENPVNNNKVLVLPGDFIDPEGSTGVVMSVPAHAPVDWVTLINLKDEAEKLKDWGINPEEVRDIKAISLIEIEGYGDFPAGEAIEEMGIKNRDDPKLKEATRTIYRKEAHSGKLKEITGKYEGKSVEEAKEELINDFTSEGFAFVLKEPGDVVVCRCGTRNHVKYLENQWFLKFSDENWKKKTHDLIDSMNVYPPEARSAFHNTIDWLENKACARRSGLGTPVPWDDDWIIETLSDSVIYMAYYIVSKYVNQGVFKEKHATDEVYDYIMLGQGNPSEVADEVDMDVDLLTSIREELEYFYGFDLRTSGKDLLNNHLSFMLMHHTAIFPDEFLPKGVGVNGYVSVIKPGSEEAIKMSKSKGNFQTIEDIIETYGVDATRLGFGVAGEGLKDAQFPISEAESYSKWLQNLYSMAFEEIDDEEEKLIDRWLVSRIQGQIKTVRNNLSMMNTRSGFQAGYHEIMQDIKWYLKRRGSKGPAYKYAVKTMVLLVCPFVPHVVEEIWEKWGNDGFAANASFPEVNDDLIDRKAENAEKFLGSFIDDIRGLRSFLKEKGNPDPEKIQVFIAPKWMYEIYDEAFQNGLDNLIGRIMKEENMRNIGDAAVNYAKELMKDGAPPDFAWTFEQEWNIVQEAKSYLEQQVDTPIEIMKADKSDHKKAKAAVPRRPGINFVIENQ